MATANGSVAAAAAVDHVRALVRSSGTQRAKGPEFLRRPRERRACCLHKALQPRWPQWSPGSLPPPGPRVCLASAVALGTLPNWPIGLPQTLKKLPALPLASLKLRHTLCDSVRCHAADVTFRLATHRLPRRSTPTPHVRPQEEPVGGAQTRSLTRHRAPLLELLCTVYDGWPRGPRDAIDPRGSGVLSVESRQWVELYSSRCHTPT